MVLYRVYMYMALNSVNLYMILDNVHLYMAVDRVHLYMARDRALSRALDIPHDHKYTDCQPERMIFAS